MIKDNIQRMMKKRGKSYIPRTRHMTDDGKAKYTNRLFLETSPYLLQHAHNPVDWFPWGEEAFKEAKRLNRPLFVSIGYSTCHWCHVMEEESFEDEEIAGYLNGHFICVKVDREERPDVDAIYMGAVQLLTGSGGWPLNVVLTPALKPFFGGTYFPARDGDRGAATGFLTILHKINEAWEQRQDLINRSSDEITRHVQQMLNPEPGHDMPGSTMFQEASAFFKKVYDPVHGGMKGAPKFPSSLPIRFLFRRARRDNDPGLKTMALHTLDAMARGGMYDHVGGGFHRYATDQAWLVPHFEKMLYDNALLAMAYLEAFRITGESSYENVVREILDYVIREMRHPDGGFYSATDADSLTPDGEKMEGYYFTWTDEELDRVLDKPAAALAKAYFSMDGPPCFEGRHIPHITEGGLDKARQLGYSLDEITLIKHRLYKERETRQRPLTDIKILTSWNGLMISAFAQAGFTLNDPDYVRIAEEAAQFITHRLTDRGRLLRTFTEDQAKYKAYLDDYAFFTAACLDLYEATGDMGWINQAHALDQKLEQFYEDKEHGGFFMTPSDHEALIAREKPCRDGALPSGNAVAVLNLLRLYGYFGHPAILNRAEKAFHAFSITMEQGPGACGELLVALDLYHLPPKEIAIVYPDGHEDKAKPLIDVLRRKAPFNRVLTVASETDAQSASLPLLSGKKARQDRALAYVCNHGNCELPVETPGELELKVGQ